MNVLFMENENIAGTRYEAGNMYEIEGDQATRALQSEHAFKFDISEFQPYFKQIDDAIGQYKKDRKRISNSVDPRYKDEDYKALVMDEFKTELRQEVDRAQAEYESFLEQVRQAAAEEVANKITTVSEVEERQAARRVKQLLSDMALGDKEQALTAIEAELKHMNEQRQHALSLELPQIMESQAVQNDASLQRRVKGLYDRTKAGNTPEHIFKAGVDAMPSKCTQAYDQLKLIDREFSEYENNVHNEKKTEMRFKSVSPIN